MVRNIVLTWLMIQSQFGLFHQGLLLQNLLMPLCALGLYEGLARYVPYHEAAGTLRRFVRQSWTVIVGLAVVIPGVLLLWSAPVGRVLFQAASWTAAQQHGDQYDTAALTRAMLLVVFTLVLYQSLIGTLKGLRMFRAVGLIELFTGGLFTVLAVIVTVCAFDDAASVMVTYAIANGCSIVIFAPGLWSAVQRRDRHDQAGAAGASDAPAADLAAPIIDPGAIGSPDRVVSMPAIVRFSAWAAGIAILGQALLSYPTWHLLKTTDAATVGAFHIVRLVAQLVQIAAVLLTAILAANVTRRWEARAKTEAVAELETLTRATLLALLAGACVLHVASPLVLRLVPGSFSEGMPAFGPVLLMYYLIGASTVLTIRFNLIEQPRWIFLAWLIGTAGAVSASFLLLGAPDHVRVQAGGHALVIAGWAGGLGAVTALLVLLGLLFAARLQPDAWSMLFCGLAFAMGLGRIGSVATLVVLVLLLAWKRGPLSAADREVLKPLLIRRLAR